MGGQLVGRSGWLNGLNSRVFLKKVLPCCVNSRSWTRNSIQKFAPLQRITFQVPRSTRKQRTTQRKPNQHYAHASFNWLDLFRILDEEGGIRKLARQHHIPESTLRTRYHNWIASGRPTTNNNTPHTNDLHTHAPKQHPTTSSNREPRVDLLLGRLGHLHVW